MKNGWKEVAGMAVVMAFAAMAGPAAAGERGGERGTPRVVAKAAKREAVRQDGTWTSENIRDNPYLFVQDQIRNCDELRAKIEAENITMLRLGKEAARTIEESDAMIARYTVFLGQAKAAYKTAQNTGEWPVILNGFRLDEGLLRDRIADALERVELAKQERAAAETVARKAEMRQGVLKTKGRELSTLRLKLVQQAEQIKMNSHFAELDDLSQVLGVMKEMMIEIDEDPTQPGIDDLAADDPDAERNRAVRAFLED